MITRTLACCLAAVLWCCVSAASGQGLPLPSPTPAPGAQPAPAGPPADPCPVIEVKTMSPQPVRDGQRLAFTAALTGGDPKAQTFMSWSLSNGVMVSGQGTPNIQVDTTGAGAGRSITATLLVGGLAPECASSGFLTVNVAAPARKVDEYAVTTEEDENARIQKVPFDLASTDLLYVFSYAGRTSPRGQSAQDLRRLRAFITKLGAPNERVVTIDGGYREQAMREIWIVPQGAEAPRSSPTLKAKDIVFPKTTPPAKPKP